MGPALANQVQEVAAELPASAVRLCVRAAAAVWGPGWRPRHDPKPGIGPDLGWDAEQMADHRDREREGERVDQVESVGVVDGRQQPIRDLADQRLEFGDRPRGERPGHQPAQPGVVRRVQS